LDLLNKSFFTPSDHHPLVFFIYPALFRSTQPTFKHHIYSHFLQALSHLYNTFLLPGKNLNKLGEWAVVTGATDGIGKAYALAFAKKGLNVMLISRTESKSKDVAAEISAKGYKVDVNSPSHQMMLPMMPGQFDPAIYAAPTLQHHQQQQTMPSIIDHAGGGEMSSRGGEGEDQQRKLSPSPEMPIRPLSAYNFFLVMSEKIFYSLTRDRNPRRKMPM
jgi:NADPH:quinone reductase-like Zn-dependent oxidoreductase